MYHESKSLELLLINHVTFEESSLLNNKNRQQLVDKLANEYK